MKCPECKEEIEDGARKCKHCGSYTRKGRRKWESAKDYVQFATFIAAIVVLGFMLWGNLIMQSSVKEARKSIDQGKEAIELTKVSLAKIDTGFALTRKQISIQQEQLDLEKKSVEQLSKEFIEEKCPRITIAATKIDLTDTNWVLYFDFRNIGFADAEEVLLHFVLKYEDLPNDTIVSDFEGLPNITKAGLLTEILEVPELVRINLTCFVEVRYRWIIQDWSDTRQKYFHYIYNEKEDKYRILVLSKESIEILWK